MSERRGFTKISLIGSLFVFAVLLSQLGLSQSASAATLTWTGGGGAFDLKFSTGANWNTGSAPVNGDAVILDADITTDFYNDIENLSLVGITVIGDPSPGSTVGLHQGSPGDSTPSSYELLLSGTFDNQSSGLAYFGGSLSLTGDTTFVDIYRIIGPLDVNGHNLSVESSMAVECTTIDGLIGAGGVTVDATNAADIRGAYSVSGERVYYTGSMDISGGDVHWDFGAGGVATTLSDGVNLYLSSLGDREITAPLNISGVPSIHSVGVQSISSGNCGFMSIAQSHRTLHTFSGTLNLGSNLVHEGPSPVAFTGPISYNGYTIENMAGDSNASAVIGASGIASIPLLSTAYADNQPSAGSFIGYNETVNLSGSRGTLYLWGDRSRIVGTGIASTLIVGLQSAFINVYNLSVGTFTLAPGNSPGTITVLDTLGLLYGSVLEVELQDTEAYDQVIAGEDYEGSSSAVIIYSSGDDASQLDVQLYGEWVINTGDQFTIIDNRSDTAVSGHFSGLDEGDQFTVDGMIFSITYEGGDGNDVVITALNTGSSVNPPNTGFAEMAKANPSALLVLGLVSAVIIFSAASRLKTNR